MAGDPYWASVVLAMHMDDVGLSDMKGGVVTLNGDVAMASDGSAFGGYCAVFDGSGDYLTVPHSTDFFIGTSDYTIEARIKVLDTSQRCVASKRTTSSPADGWSIYTLNGSLVLTVWNTVGSTFINISAAGVITTGAIHHVAFTNDGTAVRIFVDGVKVAESLVGETGIQKDSIGPLYVGREPTHTARDFYGRIDELRITKGVARYVENFTPPVARFDGPSSVEGIVKDADGNLLQRLVRVYRRDSGMLVREVFSDPVTGEFSLSVDDFTKHFVVVNDAESLVTYLDFDGADGSTVFSEWSGKSVTPYGNAKISTAKSKFGGASALFDGAGDFLTLPALSDTDFGSSDFTVEAWISLSALPASGAVMVVAGRYDAYSENRSWAVRLYNNAGTQQIGLVTSVDGVNVTVSGGNWAPSMGIWYHLAAVRVGGATRLYIDGVQLGADGAVSGGLLSAPVPVSVGTWNNRSADFFNGHIDDLRISKGIARYTANFTPPAEPQVPAGNEKNALVYDLLTPV